MTHFLFTLTGEIFEGTFAEARFHGGHFVSCNEEGNTCLYNGERVGHSKGFCTANACY